MDKNEVRKSQFNKFEDLKNKLISLQDSFYFRGMASDKWRLKTSIDRLLEKIRQNNQNFLLSNTNQNIFAELKAQLKFIENQSDNLNRLLGKSTNEQFSLDKDNFLCLPVILQHYGYPTRIQDWTENWEKGLYFCLEDQNEFDNCCIWALRKDKIPNVEKCLLDNTYLYEEEMFENNIINSFYNRLVPGVYRIDKVFFKRIMAQNGITLVNGRADYMDFQDHIIKSKNFTSGDFEKIIIDKSLRDKISIYLNEKGISKQSLYPLDITDGYVNTDKQEIEKFIHEIFPNISLNDLQ